jgi:hypothetical protein
MTRTKLAALSAITAALAIPAAAAAAPASGDWEAGTSNGALASFALTSVTTHSHGHVAHGLAVQDLVVQAPIRCRNASASPLPIDVQVVPGQIALAPDKSFTTGKIKSKGSQTAVHASFRKGKFSITYRHVTRIRNLYEGGQEVCDTRTIHLTAKRGHRRALKEGVWQGQTIQQEPVELSVVAGGRALLAPVGPGPGGAKEYAFGLAPSTANDACSYNVSYPLFVAADGTFSNAATHRGDEAVLSGRFTRPTAITGQFSNLQEACPQESWAASWSFSPK